jgi:hypothetical protein
MQTVYLLKNCKKSFDALIKLYKSADMSTNIIIVNKFQSKILLLDKRVKSFPFIINTLPTSLGMIPKIAKVLPLEYFIKLNKKNKPHVNKKPSKVLNKNSGGITIKLNNTTPIIPVKPKVINPRITKAPKNFNNRLLMYKNPPMIKKIKDSDGGINIVLKK